MASTKLLDITDIFWFFGVEFHGLPISTRIIFAVFYGLLLYVFVTKSKLRKPCNLLLCTSLWNSILLKLTVLPFALLQISISDVAKNHNIVAIQTYLTILYIWMSFSSIMLIGLNRAQKIKRRLICSNYNNNWTGIMLLGGGGIASVLMPLTTAVILFFYGGKASINFSFLRLLFITLLLILSYGIIIYTVRKSLQKWKTLQDGDQSLDRDTKTLQEIKKAVLLLTVG